MKKQKHNKRKKGKIALITGITGQDGSYLAEILLSKNYDVHGIIRRASTFNTKRIDHIFQDPHERGIRLFLHYGDLSDAESIRKLLYRIRPDEIYNLAAQSHVRISFDIPEYTANITGLGTLRLLEALRDYQEDTGKKVKFYQASSSEMFGASPPPQNENTPLLPRSPYGCAKVFAHNICAVYRESYNMFIVRGILFNHESERRGETFVTRKIARGVARIKAGLDKKIYLGNIQTRRDWGYAPEYMKAAWLMMQQSKPDDYVIGTGESHSIKEFLKLAFDYAGIKNYKKYIGIDPRYYRPSEVYNLIADYKKAKEKLSWEPKIKFEELVKLIVSHELKKLGF